MANSTFNPPAKSPDRQATGEIKRAGRRDSFARQGRGIDTPLASYVPPAQDSPLVPVLDYAGKTAKATFIGHQSNQYQEALADISRISIAENSNLMNPENPLFSEDAIKALANSKRVFNSFRAATEQGAMTDTAAKIAAESELKRLINQFPALGPEIRQAAATEVGFDPMGSMFKFNTRGATSGQDKPPTTALQKAFADNEEMAKRYGLDLEDLNARTAEQWKLKNDAELLSTRIASGKAGVNDVFNEAQITAKANIAKLQGEMFASVVTAEGIKVEGLTDEVINGLGQKAAQTANAQVIKLRSELRGRDVDPNIISTQVGLIEQSYKDFQTVLKDKSIWDSIRNAETGSAAATKLIVRGLYPTLAAASAISPNNVEYILETVFSKLDNIDESILNKVMLEVDPELRQLAGASDKDRIEIKARVFEKLIPIFDGTYFDTTTDTDKEKDKKLKGVGLDVGLDPSIGNHTTPEGTTVAENVFKQANAAGFGSWQEQVMVENPEKAMQVKANRDKIKYNIKNIDTIVRNGYQELINAGIIGPEEVGHVDISFNEEGDMMFSTSAGINLNSTDSRNFSWRTGGMPAGAIPGVFELLHTKRSTNESDLLKSLSITNKLLGNKAVQAVVGMSQQDFKDRIELISTTIQDKGMEASPVRKEINSNVIARTAQQWGVDREALDSLYSIESSRGRVLDNKEGSGAVGPFQFVQDGVNQVNKILGTEYTKEDMRDFRVSAGAAAVLLGDYTKQLGGDTTLGFAAYNGGVGGVKKYIREMKEGNPHPTFYPVEAGEFKRTAAEKTAEVENFVRKGTGVSLRTYVQELITNGIL